MKMVLIKWTRWLRKKNLNEGVFQVKKSWLIIGFIMVLVLSLLGACAKPAPAPTPAPSPAPAPERELIELSFVSGNDPVKQNPPTTVDRYFIPEVTRLVHEQTNYEIKFNTSWAGSVTKVGETLEAVQAKLADMGGVETFAESGTLLPKLYSYAVPFTSNDPILVGKVTRDLYKVQPVLTTIFDDKYNQHAIIPAMNMASYEMCSNFPIQTLEDLQGRKLCGSSLNLRWFPKGTTPVQGTYFDGYQAMLTGTWDGQIVDWACQISFNLYEVAPYATEVGFGGPETYAVTCNTEVWNSLPQEVKDIMLKVGEETPPRSDEFNQQLIAEGLEELKQKEGVTYYKLPESEKVRWAAALDNVPNEWAKEVNAAGYPGSEIIKTYIDLWGKHGYTLPRDWQID
jgi:TRAP-type C4-dicarboxylate transport system substrate-binding protein